jgi:uroporphyrinogen decarboxylase
VTKNQIDRIGEGMTGRERLLIALNHREADRVPFDLSASRSTGIDYQVYEDLIPLLKLPPRRIEKSELNRLAKPDEDVLQELAVDVRGIDLNPIPQSEIMNPPQEPLIKRTNRGYEYTDEWGRTYRRGFGDLHYSIVAFPLKDGIDEDYCFPAISENRFSDLSTKSEYLKKQSGSSICFKRPIANGFLQMGAMLYGYDKWYTMLAGDPKKAAGFMDRLLNFKLRFWEKLIEELKGCVDVVCEGDDLGTQESLLISREMYRKMIWPRQKKLFEFIKTRQPNIFIYFHSDGAISEIIPDLISAGVDILNPVQIGAKGMEPVKLKHEFGKEITFWGGGIDSQKTLPFGTVNQVKDEVRRNIDALAPGGGYVFSPIHHIQADVPAKNVLVMWEAFQEYGTYN